MGNLRQQTALCDSKTPIVIQLIDEENDKVYIAEAIECYPDTVDFNNIWTSTFKIIGRRLFSDD